MKTHYFRSLGLFFFLFMSSTALAQDLIVSGAGETEVNGVYILNGTVNNRPIFTKGTYRIQYAPNGGGPNVWQISNNASTRYFSNSNVSNPTLVLTWTVVTRRPTPALPPAPTVQYNGMSVNNAVNIKGNSADLSGYFPDDSADPVTERGVVYSTNQNPTVTDTKITIGSGSGAFSQTVSGFTPSTHYYIRAYAVNSAGVATYSDQKEFFTFAGGTGTIENPLAIANWVQLKNINLNLSASYLLVDDIGVESQGYDVLAGSSANSSKGWIPLGIFTGTLNGQNYTISGLHINDPSKSSALFQELSGATVKNVRLADFSITGSSAATLAVTIRDFNINNCHASNVSITASSQAGGLVGSAPTTSGTITNCSVIGGQINGGAATGGLMSSMSNQGLVSYVVVVSNSYTNVSVSAVVGSFPYSGGLTGSQYGGRIENCYSLGAVTGSKEVGGLIGYILPNSIVRNSYSTGAVNGGTLRGGLIGRISTTTTGISITNSFYNQDTSGQSDTGKGIPKTTAEMKNINTFTAAGWDFSCETTNGNLDHWTINETDNSGYPALSFQKYSNVGCPTWNGAVSADWSDASNWTPAAIPTSMAVIPVIAEGAFYPSLSNDTSINQLFVADGAYVDLGSKTLTVNSFITNEGVLRTNEQSSLILNSAANETVLQLDPAFNTLKNLTVDTPGSVLLDSPLAVTGTLDLRSGTLKTAGFLTLKSTAEGTANVAPVTGRILGAVQVERFIPAKRAWHALTAPLKGSNTSLHASWQNNGAVTPGFGLEIWGPNGTGMATGPAYSVLNYTPSGYVNVDNTQSTLLFDTNRNNAYLFFVTGAYGSNNITNGNAAATTLTTAGELITGDVSYANLIATRHTLIGNPYASPLAPATLLDGATNLINKFWVWDPQLGANGGYVSYDAGAGTYSNATGSYPTATTPIESGQAFFVRATSGTTGSFDLTENKKAVLVPEVSRATAVQPEIIRLGMYKQSNQAWLPLDGAITVIYPAASNDLDASDGRKFANSSENIAFRNANTSLSSEHRTSLTKEDVLHFRVWNTTPNTYKLHLNTEAFTTSGLVAKLHDLYTNTTTDLDLTGAVIQYPFVVTADPKSSGDRFQIVFGEDNTLDVNNPKSSTIVVYPNPITDAVVYVNLGNSGASVPATYQLTNLLGQIVQEGFLRDQESAIPVPGLAKGLYLLQIKQDHDVRFTTKLILK